MDIPDSSCKNAPANGECRVRRRMLAQSTCSRRVFAMRSRSAKSQRWESSTSSFCTISSVGLMTRAETEPTRIVFASAKVADVTGPSVTR